MIIRGNTVGTITYQGDYAQTDETHSDFIRNKPDAAIAKAQKTADEAKSAAQAALDSALPKAGGTMTGPIAMDGSKITGLPAAQDALDAANKAYVDGKHCIFSVSLSAELWTEEAPFTQTLSREEILATDAPHFGPVYSGDAAKALSEKEAFSYVDALDTADGKLIFTCLEDKPTVDLTLQLEVNR